LPLTRTLEHPADGQLVLVALLNPDAFGNFQEVTLNDPAAAAALTNYSGAVLAATSSSALSPGQDLSSLPPFRSFLPRIEHRSWRGDGMRQGEQIGAFRVLRSRPLVVLAEIGRETALQVWWRQTAGLLAAGGITLLVILGSAWAASRSLRREETVRAERDEAQAAVARREQELSVIFRSVQELLFRTDTQGRLSFINLRRDPLTQRSLDSLIGQPLHGVVSADTSVQVQALFSAGPEVQVRRAQARLDDPTGPGRWFDVALVPVLENGRISGFAGSAVDITEVREAERATREARDATLQASLTKSEFMANVSHELRTPLQSILGFAELGVRRAKTHEGLAGMFDDIHRAGKRMLALVNDLLDLARTESHEMSMSFEFLDIRGLVREVCREVRPLADARTLTLALDLPREPLVAGADALRFQQVVRNVLANAIRFSPLSVQIDITLLQDQIGGVLLTVADRGPSVPEDELERIFDAFIQSSRTKDGSGGTGLGLAISRRIMQAHGGTITAGLREGGGSVFRIWLPGRDTPVPLVID